jgi:hypothetical protein
MGGLVMASIHHFIRFGLTRAKALQTVIRS